MESIKTQYRIVTKELANTVNNRYLQFKSSTVIEHWFRKDEIVEEWKYIPREHTICEKGEYRTIKECPCCLAFLEKNDFIGCTIGQENLSHFGVTWFAEKYPNIEVYFAEMNAKHREYLFEQNKKKETVYLNFAEQLIKSPYVRPIPDELLRNK